MTAFDDNRRRRGRPQNLRWWLGADRGALSHIARQTRISARHQRQLQAALPQSLAGHWRLAIIDVEHLCLVTESPLWATQLRYRRTSLLRSAEAILGQRPRQFQIRIEPALGTRRLKPPARLSTAAAATLRETAECMDAGPLRDALLRLASRSRD
ncbi:MAG: DUF721 domain-containing protein [Nitrococcus sp.]|nr:DUF721 domain-containing protein [Nitrococcus sp.]